MVVYHADGLHKRIANRGSNEVKPAANQVLAHGVGLRRTRRHFLHGLPSILQRTAIDETPDVGIEAAEFFLDLEKRLRVLNGGSHLESVSDNAGVGEELRDFLITELCDRRRIEIDERRA